MARFILWLLVGYASYQAYQNPTSAHIGLAIGLGLAQYLAYMYNAAWQGKSYLPPKR